MNDFESFWSRATLDQRIGGSRRGRRRQLWAEFKQLRLAERFGIVHCAVGTSDVIIDLVRLALICDVEPLVRHEAAFVLGNAGQPAARRILRRALKLDPSPLVRHEAAMALAEVGDESDIHFLHDAAADVVAEVAASCEVAIRIIEHRIRESRVSA